MPHPLRPSTVPLLVLPLLVLPLLLLPAAQVGARTYPPSDRVGLYFDEGALANWGVLAPGVIGEIYLVLTDPAQTASDLTGFECRLDLPPQVQVIALHLPGGGSNAAVFPELSVECSPLPMSATMVLARVTYLTTTGTPGAWGVGPLVQHPPVLPHAMSYVMGSGAYETTTRMYANHEPSAVTNPDRSVVIAVEPPGCDGAWRLDGPSGSVHAARGDTTLSDLPFGEYTITWLTTGTWAPPALATWTRLHSPWQGPCRFEGWFEARSCVRVEVEPAGLAAPWFLAGPDGFWTQGLGDGEVPAAPPGAYTLIWAPLDGWSRPEPSQVTRTAGTGETLTFAGTYGSPAVVPGGALPTATVCLHPGRPNPFNPRTTLRFDLPAPARVRLEIFDVAGRLVRTLLAADLPAGGHEAAWDGDDTAGGAAASGRYLARLTAGPDTRCVGLQLVR